MKYEGGFDSIVQILLYDDEEPKWRSGHDALNSSNCGTAIGSAVWQSYALSPGRPMIETTDVNEHLVARHWHVVLATCTPEVIDVVQYKISAMGALSKWESGMLSSQPCPAEPLQRVRDIFLQLVM